MDNTVIDLEYYIKNRKPIRKEATVVSTPNNAKTNALSKLASLLKDPQMATSLDVTYEDIHRVKEALYGRK